MNRRFMSAAAAFVLALGMTGSFPLQAIAASKPINSVSIRVSSGLKAGSPLPEITIGNENVEEGEVRVSASDERYYVSDAVWLDKSGNEVKPSDEPRMTVTLEPAAVNENYFLASYKETSVKVSGGTFVSARRDGDSLMVTLMLKPVQGYFDPPVNAYWNEKNLGDARWEKPVNSSGYYEVQLYRNKKSIYSVPKTSAVSYNFYPYMTEKGDYMFKVRTIPGTDFQIKYGKKSEWIESGDLQITDRYVSDGKGQQNPNSTVKKGTAETVGWVKDQNIWHYRHPDGSLSSSKWEYINGQWYYFNGEGAMATGWQNLNGAYYYLNQNGQMALGWNRIDGRWYYFRTEEEAGLPAGTMVNSGWRTIGSNMYFFNDDGSAYTGWLSQNGKWYYFNTVNNSLEGAMFTGWIKREDKTYFADSNGAMVEGWCQIDGSWYYFYPGSGEMAYNTNINGFYVNGDGIWAQ